jgi:hypothetical protein
MNYLQCEYCRQRFYTGAAQSHIVAGCLLCGGSLHTVNRPPEQPLVTGPADHRPPLPLALLPLAAADPGSFAEARTCHRSLADFARAEVSRIHSRERDLGLRWREGSTVYRAAWIEATEELYIVQLGAPSDGGGHVELLGEATLEQLEEALAGWRDIVDQPDSLNWLRNRMWGHLRIRRAGLRLSR